MIGYTVVVNNRTLRTEWKLRDDVTKKETPDINLDRCGVGFRGFNFKNINLTSSNMTTQSRNSVSLYDKEEEVYVHPTLSSV